MCGHTRDPIIYSKFHRNPFRGFGALGGQNLAFPLLWLVAFTTACTTVQAVTNFQGLVTLILDQVILHASCISHRPRPNFIKIEETFCGQMDAHLRQTGFIKSTLSKSRPKNEKCVTDFILSAHQKDKRGM